jgi:hypothetical protein
MRKRKQMTPNPHNLAKSNTSEAAENRAIPAPRELFTGDQVALLRYHELIKPLKKLRNSGVMVAPSPEIRQ